MKKITNLIVIGLIAFSTILFAQTPASMRFHPTSGKANVQMKISNLQSAIHPLPTPNSIWQPRKRIESSWDTISGSWMFSDSVITSYNVNGQVTLELWYSSSGLSNQTIYTYNANWKLTQQLYQNWNTSLSSWDNTHQQLNTYDANNNRTQMLYQSWNTSLSSWDNSWREDDTYNVTNQLIQVLYPTWNTSTSSWDNSYKENITYNGSGVLISALDYNWNTSTSSWDNADQIINIVWYQWTGNLNTSIFQSDIQQNWNSATSSYVNAYRETDTYDAHGNQTDNLQETWQTSAWGNQYEYKNIYVYNANNNMAQDIQQNWVQWMMAVRNYWRIDYSNYTLYSAVNEVQSAEFGVQIYPNPTSGAFQIQMDNGKLSIENYQLSIYNVYGEKVYEKLSIINSPLSINLSEAKNGIYFLHLKSEQGTAVKKLIINK